MTGIGSVLVVMGHVRDRGSNSDGTKIRLCSSVVPLYLRKGEVNGRAAALAVPQGHFDGRFQRGAVRTCWARCARSFIIDD